MKGMKTLQENLRSLPKYTLSEEQKQRVSMALQKEMKAKKRIKFGKPFVAFTLICAIVFTLVLSSDSDRWFNELWQSFQPQIELTAPEATVFKNYYDVIGVEGKFGILVFNEQFVAEDARRGSKLMLYFWGDPLQLIDKNYRVEARNGYNENLILSEGVLSTSLINEDAHSLTSFLPFPADGKWQLSIFVEDQLFEEFTVDVLPSFPKTEDYSLISHPMELAVGEEIEITIESSVESKKGIEVKLLNKQGSIVSEHIFNQDGSFINGSGGYIYHYSGNMIFPENGTWMLLIEGEKTKTFKNRP